MTKDLVITLCLSLIVTLKFMDLLVDIDQAVNAMHIAQEVALLVLSGGLFVYLVYDIRIRTKKSHVLSERLTLSEIEINSLEQEMFEHKLSLFQIIDRYFDAWELTAAERDVALLLIRGYSTQEIAALRHKSEKTINNQSSSIYRKADVQGKYELSGLFLENFLTAPTD